MESIFLQVKYRTVYYGPLKIKENSISTLIERDGVESVVRYIEGKFVTLGRDQRIFENLG